MISLFDVSWYFYSIREDFKPHIYILIGRVIATLGIFFFVTKVDDINKFLVINSLPLLIVNILLYISVSKYIKVKFIDLFKLNTVLLYNDFANCVNLQSTSYNNTDILDTYNKGNNIPVYYDKNPDIDAIIWDHSAFCNNYKIFDAQKNSRSDSKW